MTAVDKPVWIMSPQAHRRLLATMADVELRDLATEITRDLVNAGVVKADGSALVVAELVHGTLTRDY